MPCGPTCHLPLHARRARPAAAPLLEQRLPAMPIKAQCTPSHYRRISRWEHEAVLEAVQRRLDRQPKAMTLRRRTVEHVFGTLKHWMGTTPFLMRTLTNVATEMSLQVLAYNLKRVIGILGIVRTMKAMRLMSA